MKRNAFTLIELLVVITIIGVLAAIASAVVSKARGQAEMAKEISAGRNLVAAYMLHANDNDGDLMAGYVTNADNVRDDRGNEVLYPAAGRYPWRIAKYLTGPVKGTLVVNKQEKLADKSDHSNYIYLVSFSPSLGMNATFVGGNHRGALAPTDGMFSRYGKFCVTKVAEVVKPSKLIAFCSAHFNGGGEDDTFDGHHLVEAPNTTARRWSGSYKESDSSEEHGYVHLRYGDRAVAVMMDGHTELLDFEQLKDMRRWSNQAAELDEPNFTVRRN